MKTKERYREVLGYALRDMIRVSLRATPKEVTFGHPCSQLIADACRIGVYKHAEYLVDKNVSEYRLNGAGLKMYQEWNAPNDYHVVISGDQLDYYPDTVHKLQAVLESYTLA